VPSLPLRCAFNGGPAHCNREPAGALPHGRVPICQRSTPIDTSAWSALVGAPLAMSTAGELLHAALDGAHVTERVTKLRWLCQAG